MKNDYSVLMSVYKNENVDNLKQSIDSILTQTIIAKEFVIVKDGPLTDELNECLKKYSENNKFIKIVDLKKNVGLGNALNKGLENCNYELIMRMDSDDYSIPERAESLLLEFNLDPKLDVLGSAVYEFIDTIDELKTYKSVVCSDQEIKQRLKFRNSMNHPTVMFKKKSVIEVEGYKEIKYNEDYFLWLRMAINKAKFKNINKSLVYMRITKDTYDRRYGFEYFINQKYIFKFMKEKQFIGNSIFYFNLVNRFFTKVLIPKSIMRLLYKKILRTKKGN